MIAALVLAAGQSSRMGVSKMTLPWGETTVIGKVVATLKNAGIQKVVVITGGYRQEVEAALSGQVVDFIFNPAYTNGEMLDSFRCGLEAFSHSSDVTACLVVLGDQPQMEESIVRAVLDTSYQKPGSILMPSYQKHRGHPWVLPRCFWSEIIALQPPANPRSFLNDHADRITYLNVDTPTIIQDLDTPEEYKQQKP